MMYYSPGLVDRKVGNAIHWIILSPVDNAINYIGLSYTYPLDNDLSDG